MPAIPSPRSYGLLRRVIAEVEQRLAAGPEPVSPSLARHPIGPEVKAGDRVRVLKQPNSERNVSGYGEVGSVLEPGYDLSRLTLKSEPAMRVIAVRLDSGRVIDVTGWEKL